MKKLTCFAVFIMSASMLLAQSRYKSSEYLKMVGDASGGPAGINVSDSRSEHETQLAALQSLLPEAPDQNCSDAVNANISVLLALLGKPEDAQKTLEQIKDLPTREKRKIHVFKITKGKQAAMDYTKTLLEKSDILAQDHVIYVEKLVSVLGKDEKNDEEVIEMATSALEKAQFQDGNARVGLLLVKFQQKAIEDGLGEKDKTRLLAALEQVVSSTPDTEKTQPLIDEANKTIDMLPAK